MVRISHKRWQRDHPGLPPGWLEPPMCTSSWMHTQPSRPDPWQAYALLHAGKGPIMSHAVCAGVQIGRTFHVGDTPYDVQAGAAAGAHAIGVLTGVHSEQDLTATGVGAILAACAVLRSQTQPVHLCMQKAL